jgi:hypothetical protein
MKTPLPDVTTIVKPVWDNPGDDALRAVIADELLELGHPWGDLINLQLRISVAAKSAKPADKKLALTLAKRHRDVIGGPIAKISNTVNHWICEKGFLVECDLHRRLVKRPNYEAAAKAPHWATVRCVHVSILHTPQWFLRIWMKNPALKSLREVDVSGGLQITRESEGAPWRVTKADGVQFYGNYLAAIVTGMSDDERKRLDYAPGIRPAIRKGLEDLCYIAGTGSAHRSA